MLNLILCAVLAAGAPGGKLTVKTADLAVSLESSAGWTIRSVDYQGDRLIIPAGGQGAVIATKDGAWLGSVMNSKQPEPVATLTVRADGKAVEPAKTVEGKVVAIHKESMLDELKHTADTTIEADTIVQRHRFVAQADTRLKAFYAFIYSLTPSAKSWLAQPLHGALLRGAFNADKCHKPGRVCRWLAQYDPKTRKGALLYLPTPLPGPGASSNFWDTKGYHKFIAQPTAGAIKKGAEFDFTLVMQFFSAEPQAWEANARELAAALVKRFPPKKAPAMPEPKRIYDEGVPEQGIITCKTDHYTVNFHAKAAWTIRDIAFDGRLIALANGFYGTVMVPKGGRFWGTGHRQGGPEIVHALELTVDGQPRPFKVGATYAGHKVTLLKRSTIWKFKTTEEVSLTEDHVLERTQLAAVEDTDMSLIYYFMHCFPPSTTKWLTELPDGKLAEGGLDHSKKMAVNRDVRWIAQFDPEPGLGLLCYMPKVVVGAKSCSMIWQQPHYHKYYTTQNRGQSFKAGDKMDYTVIVKAVAGETGDWAATEAAAAALKETFPPE